METFCPTVKREINFKLNFKFTSIFHGLHAFFAILLESTSHLFPGTKHVEYLEENLLATRVKLTAEDLRRLDEIAPIGSFSGTRYPEQFMQSNRLKSEEEVIKEYARKGLK